MEALEWRLNEQIGTIEGKIDDNERDRLRDVIINFASKLEQGYIPSTVEFEHIHHAYDKYHDELGGNSYIVGRMNYIKAREIEINEKRVK